MPLNINQEDFNVVILNNLDKIMMGELNYDFIEKESNQIIGGPGRCANELAFLCKAGESPHLYPKVKKEKVDLYQTIRQGIGCDVDKDGKTAKVKFCYFIKMKNRNWNRTKEVIKMKSDFSGYIREKVTFRYPNNPENRDAKLKKEIEG